MPGTPDYPVGPNESPIFIRCPTSTLGMVLKWELKCVELEWQARIFRRMPKDHLQSPVTTLTREFGTTLPSAMASTGSSQGAGMSAPT